jgi:hypothetical protein
MVLGPYRTTVRYGGYHSAEDAVSMSAVGPKQTFHFALRMSALGGKASLLAYFRAQLIHFYGMLQTYFIDACLNPLSNILCG